MVDLDADTPEERRLVRELVKRYRRFGLEEIGAMTGYSRERIRQIEAAAIQKIAASVGRKAADEIRGSLRELDAQRQPHWTDVEEPRDT